MPEGPEVRKYADALAEALVGKSVIEITARTKNAKAWLLSHAAELKGKKVKRVYAHGKNIIGLLSSDYFFYAHQMMWGRWIVVPELPAPPPDRRERARITVKDCVAILNSAPVFEVGRGDPKTVVPFLGELGPNLLPYPGEVFDEKEVRKRLLLKQHKNTPIGSALLDQSIVAGVGNYLRAEILFQAKINPWIAVKDLSTEQLASILNLLPVVTLRAYLEQKTVTDELREKMSKDDSLVYVPGKEYGTRHYAFRRTNLPCLVCATPIKQLRQTMGAPDAVPEEEAMSRIVYFCPTCQNVDLSLFAKKPVRRRVKTVQ